MLWIYAFPGFRHRGHETFDDEMRGIYLKAGGKLCKQEQQSFRLALAIIRMGRYTGHRRADTKRGLEDVFCDFSRYFYSSANSENAGSIFNI